MPGFARASDLRVLLAALGLVLGAAMPARAEAPKRVASMNLCTDQLAMLIAAPGQLVSVSNLASRAEMSAMAEEAAGYPVNHGRAEELYLLAPDIVLADVWSSPATVSMLRRLGVEVVQFTPGASMAEIRDNIARMGEVLGQEARAEEILAAFDGRLADLTADVPAHRPRAAIYGPSGYTYGPNTLAGQILLAAGFDNIASELGLDWGGTLPLESLIMAAPDLVIASRRERGATSRSEEILGHPALRGLRRGGALTDESWACATPFVLEAVADLIHVRHELEAEG